MHRIHALILSFLLCLQPAIAAQLPHYYQVREPVASQMPDERDAALVRALRVLILRMTGDPDAMNNAAFAPYLNDPQSLIQQYVFNAVEPQALVVDFDPGSVDRAMREAGVPIWGSHRPSILVWWLQQEGEESSLWGDIPGAESVLERAADYRGLPIVLPLADLPEQTIVNRETLLADPPEAIRQLSERYAVDGLLTVYAQSLDNGVQGQWTLWIGDDRRQGQVQAENLNVLADTLLLQVANQMASRYATGSLQSVALTVEVRGVSYERHAQLQRLMTPFSAQLKQIKGETLIYQVKADPEQLRMQMQSGQLTEIPVIEEEDSNLLRFTW